LTQKHGPYHRAGWGQQPFQRGVPVKDFARAKHRFTFGVLYGLI